MTSIGMNDTLALGRRIDDEQSRRSSFSLSESFDLKFIHQQETVCVLALDAAEIDLIVVNLGGC
ncbi:MULTISPECIES: hypothetical protein [unclassified Bradyrhizobium]|uniref:hypothetical protein n=1 Tax=unclassified Bradyrhizobium TaxID=2631580 RepID=UPI0028ECAC57|nr:MULTISPECIES: hypothetical protein [unclassified Bradyrhizobium]